MTKGRVEAFSDGVLAIVITIMVLELKVPHGHGLAALLPLLPVFLSYVLSFVYVGIYWNNHHHMFQSVKHVGGWVLWANLHLLFWLSLIPFTTGFMGENSFAQVPLALYIIDLMLCGFAYFLLERALVAQHGRDSEFARATRGQRKDIVSVVAYVIALVLNVFNGPLALAIVAGVAVLWFIPDRRFERPARE